MVRTQIQLTEVQASTLKRLARSRQLSMAELIRQAVDNLIETSTMGNIDDMRKKALEAVGRFGSGKRDISKEHDKYLAEAIRK